MSFGYYWAGSLLTTVRYHELFDRTHAIPLLSFFAFMQEKFLSHLLLLSFSIFVCDEGWTIFFVSPSILFCFFCDATEPHVTLLLSFSCIHARKFLSHLLLLSFNIFCFVMKEKQFFFVSPSILFYLFCDATELMWLFSSLFHAFIQEKFLPHLLLLSFNLSIFVLKGWRCLLIKIGQFKSSFMVKNSGLKRIWWKR